MGWMDQALRWWWLPFFLMLKEKIVLLEQINYDKKMNSHITERRIMMLPTTIDGWKLNRKLKIPEDGEHVD